MKSLNFSLLPLLASCASGELGLEDTRASVQETGEGIDPDLADILEVAQLELEGFGVPGVTLAILLDGEVVLAEGLGTRVPGQDDPLEATALMRIGSVTKMLTAAGLLTRVDAGDIGLDDPLSAALPDFSFSRDSSWVDAITIEHLLSHQSGVVDWIDDAQSGMDRYLETWLTGEFASYAYLMASAGSFFNYSNPNFSLAGLVLEKLDGRYYREILDTEIFSPLGMDRTFFKADEVFEDGDYAVGLSPDPTGETTDLVHIEPDSYKNAANRPAGYAWSSVLDLLEFARFLMEGDPDVLSETLRAQMQSERVNTHYYLDLSHYGYGLMRSQGLWGHQGFYSTPVVSHDGAIWGFSASLLILPEQGFAMAVLANGNGAFFKGTMAYAAETLADLPAPEAYPDPEIHPEDFDAFVGSYYDPYNVGDIHVSLVDEVLHVEMPLLEELGYEVGDTLEPASRGNFQLTVDNYPHLVSFLGDTDAGTNFLRARYFVGERSQVSLGPRTQPGAAQVHAWIARSRESPPLPLPLTRP